MAIAILTPDEVNALVENEPEGTRVHKLTLTREANVAELLADSVPVGAAFKVAEGDETKENGESVTLSAIVAAYKRIVKSQKLGDRIAVRPLKRENAVLVKRVK